MSEMSKFVDELVKRNLAAILPDEPTNEIQAQQITAAAAVKSPNEPLLAQLPPRECLVFMAEYRIKDRYGHCLSPVEVRSQLGLTVKEYNRILDAARKKLV